MKMNDVIQECRMKGNHFFDKDTMEWWGAEICGELLDNGCFITADYNFDRTKKLYSVRQYRANHKGIGDMIDTIGFQKWSCYEDALEFAQEV